MKDSRSKHRETTQSLEKNTNRMIHTRTPVPGVLVFIVSGPALAIYSISDINKNGVIYIVQEKDSQGNPDGPHSPADGGAEQRWKGGTCQVR